MTDGIARAMSAGCQSPLAPSDEGAATEGDWGRDIRFAGPLVFIVSPCSLYSENLVTFGESDYDQSQATGFINLWGLTTKMQALKEQGKL